MQQIRLRRVLIIGLVIGVFHLAMPFIGMVLGKIISERIDEWTMLLSGLLLFGIGAQMFFSAFRKDRLNVFKPAGIGLILFASTVSLDSFSVGLSLGMSSVHAWLVIIMFGLTSTLLTWFGLLLGRKVRGLLGVYSELFGGSVLAAFGLFFIFG